MQQLDSAKVWLGSALMPGAAQKYGHAKGSASQRLAGGLRRGYHSLGNRRHLAKGLISEKGRSPSINSGIVM